MHDCFLLIKSGERSGERLVVVSELVLGRDVDGPGRLADQMLSRRHAQVRREGSTALLVTDLGSQNGTFVNGHRVNGPAPLAHGDVLEVGDTRLEVHCEAGSPAPVEQVGAPTSIGAVPRRQDAPSASLLYAGTRRDIPPQGLTIGRLADNDLVVESAGTSRRHARISARDGRHYVVDLNSANGTYLNGERLLEEARWLSSGDSISVGGHVLRYVKGFETRIADTPVLAEIGAHEPRRISFAGTRLGIGRDPANDVRLDSPTISRFNSEVVRTAAGVELHDLGSRNGTRLDGVLVERALLRPGSEIGVGPFRLIYDGEAFLERDDRGALRLDAYDVSVAVKRTTILHRASLSLQPGELVAVIGESGSGKTTLMRVLVGTTRPSAGVVLVNGEPLESRLTDIGYLPQDEIVHPRLTVFESLRHSARLRLPQDSSATEIDAAVQRVLVETSLEQHVETRIGSLSGGQRKRVGLATELLSRPGLLFLDEPTTGLDPGLEGRMMELFKQLSSVGKQALLVVTHATRNLAIADRLCVLARGGHVCFSGTPEQAKGFFEVGEFDDIYGALEERPPEEWVRKLEDTAPSGSAPVPAAAPARRAVRTRRPPTVQQTGVLSSRYFKVFGRDRRNVLILLLQAPLIGLAMALLFKPEVFAPPPRGIASSATQLLFVLVVTTIWLGTLASARELIKERAVFERERAIGVSVVAYVASKLAILFPLVVLQAVLLMAVVTGLRPLHESTGTYAALFGVLALTGFSAVSMGLFISSVVRTDEQAMALIPVAMIVQLLFGGAIVTVAAMGALMSWFSAAIFARWAYAGAGTVIDMNERIAGDPAFRDVSQYGPSFFDLSLPLTYVVLVSFTSIFIAAALLLLRRRGT
jgi:ABC-type multidrug transport system ATPase subunit/pSer/pThr/pTyr-binding forkhead associated (FHA) protein